MKITSSMSADPGDEAMGVWASGPLLAAFESSARDAAFTALLDAAGSASHLKRLWVLEALCRMPWHVNDDRSGRAAGTLVAALGDAEQRCAERAIKGLQHASISFTVFTVSDRPTASAVAAGIAAASAPAERMSFLATIVDDSHANYAACGRSALRRENAPAEELVDLHCRDRAAVQARTGATVHVRADRFGEGYLIRPRDGFRPDTELMAANR
jgi:hypothetical protein